MRALPFRHRRRIRPARLASAEIYRARCPRGPRRRACFASRRRVRQVPRGAPQELRPEDEGFATVVHDTGGARPRRLHRAHVPPAALHRGRVRGDDPAPPGAHPKPHVERPRPRRTHRRRPVQTPLVAQRKPRRQAGRGVRRDRPALRRRFHDAGGARVLHRAQPGRHRRARHPRHTGGARGVQERSNRLRRVRKAEGRIRWPRPRLVHREPAHPQLALHRTVRHRHEVLQTGHRGVPHRVPVRGESHGARARARGMGPVGGGGGFTPARSHPDGPTHRIHHTRQRHGRAHGRHGHQVVHREVRAVGRGRERPVEAVLELRQRAEIVRPGAHESHRPARPE